MACSPSYSPVPLMASHRCPSDKVADGPSNQHWFEPNWSTSVRNEPSEVHCTEELSRARALYRQLITGRNTAHVVLEITLAYMRTEVRHTRRVQHVQRVPACRYRAGRMGFNMLLPVCNIQGSNLMASEGHNSRKPSMASTNFDKVISLMIFNKSTDSCVQSLGHSPVS